MKKIGWFFKPRWAIIGDTYLGYQVYYKPWYFPFWMQHGFTNTHRSIEKAEEYIELNVSKIIKEVDPYE